MGKKWKGVKEALRLKADESNHNKALNLSTPTLKMIKSKHSNESNVRRSGRLQMLTSPVVAEPVVEEIDLTDKNTVEEIPEEPDCSEEPVADPECSKEHAHIDQVMDEIDKGDGKHDEEISANPTEELISTKEKFEFLYKTAKELEKSKAYKRPSSSETTYGDLNYKSLYIASHQKIEVLTEENSKLAKKLEYALGKIEAYEKMNGVDGKPKDMMVLTNLSQIMAAAASPNLALKTHGENCGGDGHCAPKPSPQPKAGQKNAPSCSKRKKSS
ncbi:unnamed protein product [Cuscuta europaea]|uniref:Uncharacterized protein n=1 Tax=Cuscuta europaea TaxID=41803 RepID=A0A9P0YT19_CUSEU|nr:unnamed protein product [Cuscuta europaea]